MAKKIVRAHQKLADGSYDTFDIMKQKKLQSLTLNILMTTGTIPKQR